MRKPQRVAAGNAPERTVTDRELIAELTRRGYVVRTIGKKDVRTAVDNFLNDFTDGAALKDAESAVNKMFDRIAAKSLSACRKALKDISDDDWDFFQDIVEDEIKQQAGLASPFHNEGD